MLMRVVVVIRRVMKGETMVSKLAGCQDVNPEGCVAQRKSSSWRWIVGGVSETWAYSSASPSSPQWVSV